MLTDDEAIALAADRSTSWPSGLPTVEVTAEAALAAASFRGKRSLFVRGLLESDANGEVAQLADAVTRAPRRLTTYLGDSAYEQTNWALFSAVHLDGKQTIVETVNSVGVHRLEHSSWGELRALWSALLDAVVESGPASDQADDTDWLCLLYVDQDRSYLAAARRGEVLAGDVVVDGAHPRPRSPLAPLTIAEAVAALGALIDTPRV